ncbi:MAG: arylesterase [Opitutaceae bacterium]|nr:arylesterase [Opitutaceae bacterium]
MPISFPARRLLGLICACFASALSQATAAESSRTIVFFGDSLTAGYGLDDPSSQGYPALIQKKIEAAGLPWRTVNAGLSGETSAGGLRRIDWILRQPIDVFVLALGANDGLRGIDPASTRQNLQKILERVRAKYPQARLMVAGMKMPPTMGTDFAQAFDEMYPALAAKNDATLIPFLLDGVAGDPRLNQGDRIHPTAAGQAILADNVWTVLRKML